MGFEYSSETFIKGDSNIVILYEIGGLADAGRANDRNDNFHLVVILEMEPIKTDLFDCD